MVHDRHIPLEGASNFRDLGGLPLPGGARVRRRRVYRSAVLSRLTAADHARLREISLQTVVDLRSEGERKSAPSRLPPGVRVLTPGDGGVGAQPGVARRRPQTAEDALQMMVEGNRTYPERLVVATGATFRALAGEAHGGVLFHCTAGKDRTGFIAAMILSALGASEETIVDDYVATNALWDRQSTFIDRLPAEAREPIFAARAEYIAAALEEVNSRFGSAEAYLTVRCGVDEPTLERVRSALIEGD